MINVKQEHTAECIILNYFADYASYRCLTRQPGTRRKVSFWSGRIAFLLSARHERRSLNPLSPPLAVDSWWDLCLLNPVQNSARFHTVKIYAKCRAVVFPRFLATENTANWKHLQMIDGQNLNKEISVLKFLHTYRLNHCASSHLYFDIFSLGGAVSCKLGVCQLSPSCSVRPWLFMNPHKPTVCWNVKEWNMLKGSITFQMFFCLNRFLTWFLLPSTLPPPCWKTQSES